MSHRVGTGVYDVRHRSRSCQHTLKRRRHSPEGQLGVELFGGSQALQTPEHCPRALLVHRTSPRTCVTYVLD